MRLPRMTARRLLFLAVLLGASYIASIFVASCLHRRFLDQARSITAGDMRAIVVRKLGAPRIVYARGERPLAKAIKAIPLIGLFVREPPETWVYGSFFRLRFLGEEEDDVLVEFGEDGSVVSVVVPEVQ
jgi:hypothetical protein